MRKLVAEALALRVAARHQLAMEFPNSEALKEYLKKHPQADKSNHTVKKPDAESKPKDEQGEGHEPKKRRSWKDLVSGLSSAAKSFVQEAPKAVKSFVNDQEYRRKALLASHEALTSAPGEFVKRVIKETKHEAHELKTAGQGIAAVLKGGKMSKEQKHAVRTIGIHIAIATAATALTGGLGLGAMGLAKGTAGAFVKSVAKKIALKAVTQKLSVLPTMEELAHAGHGAGHSVVHMFKHMVHASDKEIDPQEAFEAFIAAAVADGLKDLDADTLAEALEEAAKGSED